MAKAKKSLQAALASTQSRLKKNAQAKNAGQVADQRDKGKKKKLSVKGKEKPRPRSTLPFRATDKILLVGEGNFSFAHALALHPPLDLVHLPASNVYATAYDSEDACYTKYPDARAFVAALRTKGVHVLFDVDATRLDKCVALRGKLFDRIVWNFPHAGKGITDQDRNIRGNQVLILEFLRSAQHFLARGPAPWTGRCRKPKRSGEDEDEEEEDGQASGDDTGSHEAVGARGTILITLRNVPPYTEWGVPGLAKNPPLPRAENDAPNPTYTQLRSFAFHRQDWQGYAHRMTKGERAHGTGTTGEGGEDRTWEFYLSDKVTKPATRSDR